MTTSKHDYNGQKQMLTIATLGFFISVMVWFNMAPFQSTIQGQLALSSDEIGALMIVNLALSIPGRIVVGRLVDRYGPRNVFSILLITMSIPCFVFALGTTYMQLLISRLILGTIGASFVIGIRMVTEWFPTKQAGLAQGIYAGWGNFGSAFAALTLPTLAVLFGGENGWRYAMCLTGILALLYGVIFFFKAKNTPNWKTFHYTKTANPIKATSQNDFIILLLLTIPIYGGMAILVWTLQETGVLSDQIALVLYTAIILFYAFNMIKRWKANRSYLQQKVPDNEKFSMKNVAILSFGYFATFGSELAIISMLPMFFQNTFTINAVFAAAIASSFAFTNLIARPAGGWLSDRFGRKKITMLLLASLSLLYIMMTFVNSSWPIYLALVLTICCSLLSQAASGAIFSMVSLVKKNRTGQIAGMVGAYGNIGSLCFLAVLNLFFPVIFFVAISIILLLCFLATTQLNVNQSKQKLNETNWKEKAI
ncbi:MFS transporter, NNP family, nitrate/nitrite transporter [Gracilibacillus orientalis]|uniref:MFS transporter, NNP family, nitrate/nitrite transporter n=1 Tax=Gracilibacillus orientalis TaxID=334253 RepID=A0A1I4MGT3_9BACI|nr:MFS transporter [Gracilibacillus orientalis]SFM02275.1 MFS transporter, NNP family, nitrate/nitrite transporter [Gracilibacillus orientalis]